MAIVSDAFTGTNGTALGTYSANWVLVDGNAVDMEIQSNGVSLDNNGRDACFHYGASTFANDHYSQVTLVARVGGIYAGPATRCGATTSEDYYGYYADGADAQYLIEGATSVVTLATNSTIPAVNDVMRLTSTGNMHTCTRNGSTTNCPTATSDATYGTGRPGICGFGGASGNGTRIDDWSSDDNTGGAATVYNRTVFGAPIFSSRILSR